MSLKLEGKTQGLRLKQIMFNRIGRNVIKETLFFRDSPYNKKEELPAEMTYFANKLKEAGFEHLIPTLDKVKMSQVLNDLERSLCDVLNNYNVSGQPTRGSDDIKNIRELMQQFMFEDGLTGLFNIKVYPPEALSGLTGMNTSNWLEITDIGKVIQEMKRDFPNMSIFMHAGRARDTARTKPERYQWETLPITAMRLFNLRKLFAGEEIWGADVRLHPPRNDSDFIIFTPDEQITLNRIKHVIAKIFNKNNYGWVEEVPSSRRSGFVRLDFGVIGKQVRDLFDLAKNIPRVSLGHFFGPYFDGQYDIHNSPLTFWMESARIDVPILLVPYKGTIWGIALDFFGGFNDVQRHRLNEQIWLNYLYRLMVYHFPELTFPQDDPQQMVFALGYMMRTSAYYWGMPAISASRSSPIMESDLEPTRYHIHVDEKNPILERMKIKEILRQLPKPSGSLFYQKWGVDPQNPNRKGLHKQTQEWLTENVTIFLYNLGINEPSELGSLNQRLEFGLSFWEDIAQALDADTIGTLLRLMPSGECYTQDKQLFELNLFGFGIIDKIGVITNLAEYWEKNPETKEKLVNKILSLTKLRSLEAERNRLLKDRESITGVRRTVDQIDLDKNTQLINDVDRKIEEIISAHLDLRRDRDTIQARTVFFDYLFDITKNDARHVLALLKPVWCSDEEWQEICNNKKNINRLIELDDRFEELQEKPNFNAKYRRRILSILSDPEKPCTMLQVFQRYIERYTRGRNPKTSHIFTRFIPLMYQMLADNEIVGVGDSINIEKKERGDRLPFNWFCLPDHAARHKDRPEYQTIKDAVRQALLRQPCKDVEILATELGFTYKQLNDVLNILEKSKEVVYEYVSPGGPWHYRINY